MTKQSTIEFTENNIAGKLLHLCVRQLESLQTPWNLTSEDKQKIILNAMEQAVIGVVREAVEIIATDKMPALRMQVDSVTFKDGVKAVMSTSKSSGGRHALADSEGGTVLVVIAQPENFTGGTKEVKAQPDQAQLPLGESLPEIRPYEDGFMIYKDEMPMAGAQKFSTHENAETWLQVHLGVAAKPREPADRDEQTLAKAAETMAAQEPAPAPKLEDAVAVFKQAGLEEAKKDDGDFDTGWSLTAEKYPKEFVEEYYDELQKAFADGWEEGDK